MDIKPFELFLKRREFICSYRVLSRLDMTLAVENNVKIIEKKILQIFFQNMILSDRIII